MDSTTRLYNGEVELVFDEKKHRYTANGVAVPSVTSIVGVLDKSGPLVGWSLKIAGEYVTDRLLNLDAKPSVDDVDDIVKKMKSAPRKLTKAAADIGTQAHAWIEQHIKAQLKFDSMPESPTNEKVLSCTNAFLRWEKENYVDYVASERKIYSRQIGYAGTLDVIAHVNRRRVVLDLKTSNGVYPEYLLQTSGYQMAYEEETGEMLDGRIILKISKEDALFEETPLDSCHRDGTDHVFESCCDLYFWLQKAGS